MSLEDKAQDHEVAIWTHNNRPRDVARFLPTDVGYGPADCGDCAKEMHPVRRSYGFTRCTSCASALEVRGR